MIEYRFVLQLCPNVAMNFNYWNHFSSLQLVNSQLLYLVRSLFHFECGQVARIFSINLDIVRAG